ncbi:hypothetical protein F7725_006022 [Dissostichus mawsoni]|uniref:F-box domain-containing protein n=1 Tax=Dissostichus mawsoni TaxID=36200 RepID=A0A7J5YVY8_DISMA|nr:hypothetical protein F7725_006022 [Dissostichus mawsoni]
MHHDPASPSPVFLCSKRRASLMSTCDVPPQNFAETLPTEMSERIFGELDTESLCSAALTCRQWHDIIEESEQVWRNQCSLVRAVCQREVDSDRRDGLSWKRDWLRGRFSHVRSAEELRGRKMTPLDAETWGEILQAELDR